MTAWRYSDQEIAKHLGLSVEEVQRVCLAGMQRIGVAHVSHLTDELIERHTLPGT